MKNRIKQIVVLAMLGTLVSPVMFRAIASDPDTCVYKKGDCTETHECENPDTPDEPEPDDKTGYTSCDLREDSWPFGDHADCNADKDTKLESHGFSCATKYEYNATSNDCTNYSGECGSAAEGTECDPNS